MKKPKEKPVKNIQAPKIIYRIKGEGNKIENLEFLPPNKKL